jgi:HEAT repeat protein
MVELRQEIIDACQPDVLLERSADLLLALVMIEDGGEQPGFSIEALEEIVREALGRGSLALAVRVLQSLGAIEEQTGDPTRERADRIANLRRKAADRDNVAQVAGLLRQGSAVQQLDAIVGYLRLVPANGINEFAALLADEPDRRTRVLMCEVLARLGPAALPELELLFGDKRWFVVRNALYILGKVRHPSALASALAAFDHPHPRVRVEAIRAASLIDGAGAAEHLGRRTHDSDPTVRSAAIAALSMPGHDAAIPPLRDVLLAGAKGPEDVDVKLEAIRALVTIGTALAQDTLAMIAGQSVRFWQRADRQVRDAAAAALTSREGRRGG